MNHHRTAEAQNKILHFGGVTPLKPQRVLRFCDKGITLIELIIAISLLLLVLAAAMSVDMVGQWFFKSTSVQAEIQDELQPAMEHMVKNIQLANEIYRDNPTQVRVKIDVTITDGELIINNTPGDPNDDSWFTYNRSDGEIHCSYNDTVIGNVDEVIAKWIINNPSGNDMFLLSGISLTIEITGERLIQGSTESVTLISGVTLRCQSAIWI